MGQEMRGDESMKAATLEALEKFVNAVEVLAHAVSSFAGTDAVKTVYEASKELKDCIGAEEID